MFWNSSGRSRKELENLILRLDKSHRQLRNEIEELTTENRRLTSENRVATIALDNIMQLVKLQKHMI